LKKEKKIGENHENGKKCGNKKTSPPGIFIF
jgi:hypothetical protein